MKKDLIYAEPILFNGKLKLPDVNAAFLWLGTAAFECEEINNRIERMKYSCEKMPCKYLPMIALCESSPDKKPKKGYYFMLTGIEEDLAVRLAEAYRIPTVVYWDGREVRKLEVLCEELPQYQHHREIKVLNRLCPGEDRTVDLCDAECFLFTEEENNFKKKLMLTFKD